jgi:protein SCO1/2
MKYFLVLFCLTLSAACSKPAPPAAQSVPVEPSIKRYHLKGEVLSVDQKSKMLKVDGEDIPGFMPAMAMPYEVKPETELDKLKPGDAITADVVVQDDKAWLENITVTGHAAPTGKSQ